MKIVGIILIVISLALGYFGITTIMESSESVKLLGLELGVADSSQKTTGYVITGLALVILVGGIFLVRKK